jgi:hypothetical protein
MLREQTFIVFYPDGMVSYIVWFFVSVDWNFGRHETASEVLVRRVRL